MSSLKHSRAWVMVEPGKIELQTLPIPEVSEDSGLLRVEACGICGSDKHAYDGHLRTAPFPMIPGHEFIGTIEKLGKSANEHMVVIGKGPIKEGDRVAVPPGSLVCGRCWYCLHMPNRPAFCPNRTIYGFSSVNKASGLWGGYSEYVYLHSKTVLFKLPQDMPMERAILAEPMATGLRAVERALNPGEAPMGHGYGVGKRAMVIGAGPIGIMAVIALRSTGAGMIIVQDLLEDRLDMAKKMGADVVINGKLSLDERLKQVRDMTDGVGVDLVIEAAGVPVAFQEAVAFARRGGKLVEVGHYTDTGEAKIRPWEICNKDLEIFGSWGYPGIIFEDALSLLSRTHLQVEDVVTHKFSLEDVPMALNLVGKVGVGKVVIKM